MIGVCECGVEASRDSTRTEGVRGDQGRPGVVKVLSEGRARGFNIVHMFEGRDREGRGQNLVKAPPALRELLRWLG